MQTLSAEVIPTENPAIQAYFDDIDKELEKIDRQETRDLKKKLSFGESLEEDEPIYIPNAEKIAEMVYQLIKIKADKLAETRKWKQKYPFKIFIAGSKRYWKDHKIIVRCGNPIMITVFGSPYTFEKKLADVATSIMDMAENFPRFHRQTAIALWDSEKHKRTKKLTLEQWENSHMTYVADNADLEISGKITVKLKHRKTGIVSSIIGDIKDEAILKEHVRMDLSRKVFEAEHRQEIENLRNMGVIEQ